MVVSQSNRVAAMENPSKEDLMTVLPEDLDIEGDDEEDAKEEAQEEAAETPKKKKDK